MKKNIKRVTKKRNYQLNSYPVRIGDKEILSSLFAVAKHRRVSLSKVVTWLLARAYDHAFHTEVGHVEFCSAFSPSISVEKAVQTNFKGVA